MLKSRGLNFRDESKSSQTLKQISYYRLRAYTFPFQENSDESHKFIVQIDFEEIIALYNFDKDLRLLIFEALETIEVALRTQIIYHFALQYGSHWQTNQELYRDENRFREQEIKVLQEINRSEEVFLKHYSTHYTSPSQPPSWMGLEVVSIGTLSKIFQNLKKCKAKNSVVTYFGLPNTRFLENWMFCFTLLRNICAHHSRLWNRRLTAKPKLPYNAIDPFLSEHEIREVFPNKLYPILCCIKYTLNRLDTTNNFHNQLISMIANCPLLQEKEMGFPKSWREQVLWK